MDNINFKQIKQAYWQNIRKEFHKVNAKLAQIIDDIDPQKTLPFIKVTYAFGDKILENGKFTLLETLKDNSQLLGNKKSQTFIEQLSYSAIPLGLFLNKSCETFIEIRDRIIPLFVLAPGFTIGLYETLDVLCNKENKPLWNVTAGVRSIFMLAKINNSLWHKRLVRNFDITAPTPTSLSNQWEVFVNLANSEAADCDWHCDLVFFTKDWFDHLSDNSPKWASLREYLFRECWLQSGTMIEKNFSFMWQQFSLSTIRRKYHPRIYITDTIRHLISIAYGLAPAFAPAITELSAPVKLIKKAYHQVYDLPHTPTLMEPVFLHKPDEAVYYSLGYPTLLEGHPEISNIYNTISDLKEIKLLMENMYHYYQGGFSFAKKFEHIIQKVNFKYYHKVLDKHREIEESSQLIEIDKNFVEPEFAGKPFCATSPFFNGCIQVQMNF